MHRVQSRDFMDIDKLPSADGIGVLEIRALGRLQLQLENRIISAFPTRKAEELLAFLLYFYGTPHKRERLIEMLWPGVRPDVGRSRLSTTLWRVRGLLENLGLIPNHYLESTGDSLTLSIHPQTFFDVQAFVSRIEAATLTADEAEMASHLTAAEELWCGELFEGIYADWCLIERERLNRLRMRGLGKLVAHHFDAGQYDDAIDFCQRILAVDPLREEVHRALMRCYAKKGRRSEGILQFQRCANTLLDELGVFPMPETIKVYKNLIRSARADRFGKEPASASREQIEKTFSDFMDLGDKLVRLLDGE